jgi:hypothetical protein
VDYQLDEPGDGLFDNLTAQWATEDLSAACDWVIQQPAGELRDRLVLHVALVWSKSDPADAARLILNQIPAGDNQNEAVISVVYQWALQDRGGSKILGSALPRGRPPPARDERDNNSTRNQ